ncbi:MAG: nuclear transport factor 2 family protein [Burkholderiales bacterium]|nr:nuclear transport factor 2 family protein [Burkholderiales bacterium]
MSELTLIEALMGRYFDGLYHGDVALLGQAFHPQAIYATASGGALLLLDLSAYLQRVQQRPSPASQGHRRTDEIVSIDMAGPVTALVRAQCSIPGRDFIDLLTLVKVDQRWQIISKVFDFTPATASTPPDDHKPS